MSRDKDCTKIDSEGRMIGLVHSSKYRKDIDGLRAMAVIAVVLFHYGRLPSGYLGVDVFFVISGFLITGIIQREALEGRFSIVGFYLRRIRRILPLSLLVVAIALVVGIFVMLPDDLENLAQSAVATNLCANNILQTITTKNYWDVVNEYKPLMHTWSLGVEEQYYLFYPFLVAPLCRRRPRTLVLVLGSLAVLSLILFCLPFFKEYQKFYLLPFRFWELAAGGMAALVMGGRMVVAPRGRMLSLTVLLVLLAFDVPWLANEAVLGLTVLATLGMLVLSDSGKGFVQIVLENPVSRFLGLISFSLYMWHQLVLAFARYFWVEETTPGVLGILSVIILGLSVASYYAVEQPFRKRSRVSTPVLLVLVSGFFLLTTGASLYIFAKGGVIRDVPELGILKSGAERGIHAAYNARGHEFNKPFSDDKRTKVLVVGDSFGRDWLNVLLESNLREQIDLSYANSSSDDGFSNRLERADVVFYTYAGEVRRSGLKGVEGHLEKLWIVGTKNFGVSNGIFYNRKGPGYYEQRTEMERGVLASHERMKVEFGSRYIDLIDKVMDERNSVPVFTPERQFISQDCRHFTRSGARYFAGLVEEDLKKILFPSGAR